jgi:hypothetical protein
VAARIQKRIDESFHTYRTRKLTVFSGIRIHEDGLHRLERPVELCQFVAKFCDATRFRERFDPFDQFGL